MNKVTQWLHFFETVSCFYRQMMMVPLWEKYLDYQKRILDSLAIFLEGYAFERQGRRPDYFHAGVDSLISCYEKHEFTAECVWNKFKELLKNQNLNPKNNPLYPSGNLEKIKNLDRKLSLIEVILKEPNSSSLSGYLSSLVLQNNDIEPAFRFLKRIRGIGDKIASFYLRDMVTVLKLDLSGVKNRWLLQPVDIWVERTVRILTNNQKLERKKVAMRIVQEATRNKMNPEWINMGMWFYSAIIANSEYQLRKSLSDRSIALALVNDFNKRIQMVVNHCGDIGFIV